MFRKFLIIFIFIIFLSVAGVSASDTNQTDIDLHVDKSASECCSFIIQEKNETIFAFRQDSPLNGRGVQIHNDTLDDLDIIKEEIDTFSGFYFFHAIITQNGWVASQGGSQYNDDSKAIEGIAASMIHSNNISTDSLSQIQKVLKNYGSGHFLIKAPDGRYGVAFVEACLTGVLQPGEFLSVPNYYTTFRHGNYSGYAINPVDAIVEICSYDDSGWNRRNLYSYDYKAHSTPDGQKYGVDIYVTNDNGHNVGLNTSGIVTHFSYNGILYPASVVPQNPEKLYVGTYIFENQPIDSVFEVLDSSNNVLINTNSSIHYKIHNIEDENTIVFNLDDNINFINAEISQGNYYYDLNQHTLYWNLSTSNNANKDIILNIEPKVKGYYNIHSYVKGKEEENNLTFYATDPGVILTSDNVTTYKTYSKSLNIYLTDKNGVNLVGENVTIMINGITYYRQITPKGYAELAITLQPGEYDAIISYDGYFGKSQTTSKIIVKKTLFSKDLEIFYGHTSNFTVSCLDENGNILANSEVDFCLNGVLNDAITNDEGICSLSISKYLKPGKHSVISYNIRTNEIVENQITIKEPACFLILNKTVNASSICIGDNVEWTIMLFNAGPCTALNVTVKDSFPEGLIIINADERFDNETGLWEIGELKVNESVSLKLVTKILTEGNIVNIAQVNSSTYNLNDANNEANCTTEAFAFVDLRIVINPNKFECLVGDKIYWTTYVFNKGPCDAHGVIANYKLPPSLKFVSYKASHGNYDASTGEWYIGDLAKGKSATLGIVSIALKKGIIISKVNVTCNETEINLNNNHDETIVEVITIDDLIPQNETSISKSQQKYAEANVEMLTTANPIVCLIVVFMVLLDCICIQNRKK